MSKTALITGASRGLGLALARALAQRGWLLILDARSRETLNAVQHELAQLTKVITVAGDITDETHCQQLRSAAQQLGGLDALINNASTLGASPRPNLLNYPLDTLEAVFRTNVTAPLRVLQALAGSLKPHPRIINVTSDAAVEAYAGWGGYGASKAALEQVSAVLAQEHTDWRVYWVDPGDMRTQMHQEAFPDEDISDRPLPEESVPGFLTLLEGDFPSGRYQAQKLATPTQLKEATAPQVYGLRLILTVADFERAVALYRDGLGLPQLDQWIDGESATASKGVLLDAGKATLELINAIQAREVDAIEATPQAAGSVRLAFTVADVATAAQALTDQGSTSLSVPILTPWQHLNQRLQPPAGIHTDIQLTLSEVVKTPTEAKAEQV